MASNSDREMQRALEMDGDKLRELTGEDHGPWYFVVCPCCAGSGIIAQAITVYEPGCGFPHKDTDERPCPECDGTGIHETTWEPV